MVRTVLILGASGKIGTHAARAFGEAGWNIRPFDRNRDDMVAAAKGADVIVNGMNPPNYHDWDTIIPRITAQVIAAAKASGAMVVIPGNVYHFGDRGGTWSEETPPAPVARKGRIRLEMERAYRAAAADGVQTLVLRGGNFIDPNHDGDVMSTLVLKRIERGRITLFGAPGIIQPYCYLPDWARAVVSLAEMRDRLSGFEDVPFPGHAFTMHELRETLERELGRRIGYSRFPWWAMRLASPFWELARELLEMRYLMDTPHRLSGGKFGRLLPGFEPTPLREVMLAGLPGDIHPDKSVARGGRARAA